MAADKLWNFGRQIVPCRFTGFRNEAKIQMELDQIVKLLKKQGFYRRQRLGEKLDEKAESAPFEKYEYAKSEL